MESEEEREHYSLVAKGLREWWSPEDMGTCTLALWLIYHWPTRGCMSTADVIIAREMQSCHLREEESQIWGEPDLLSYFTNPLLMEIQRHLQWTTLIYVAFPFIFFLSLPGDICLGGGPAYSSIASSNLKNIFCMPCPPKQQYQNYSFISNTQSSNHKKNDQNAE